MMFSRIFVGKATSAADPYDRATDTAPLFQVRLHLFELGDDTLPSSKELEAITDQDTVPVFNIGGHVAVGDPVVVAYTVDERWIRVAEPPVCTAKWIKFRYVPGTGYTNLLAFYSGSDPTAGGGTPEIDYPLGEPCDEADVMAFCDENTGRYQAVSTESAMLGESEEMNIVNSLAFDGCGINYVYQPARVFPCQSQPSLAQITPDLVEREVITGAALQEAIEGCSGECEYTWDGELDAWIKTSESDVCGPGCECGPAPVGPPGFGEPSVVTVPCVRSDGQTPRPARLFFSSERVLVCSFLAYHGFEIPLAECPEY